MEVKKVPKNIHKDIGNAASLRLNTSVGISSSSTRNETLINGEITAGI